MRRWCAAGLIGLVAGCGAVSSPARITPASSEATSKARVTLPKEEVLASGGELGPEVLSGPSVWFEGDVVIAVGTSEVPGDARLEMALAGADALARAELLKALAVSVRSLEISVENEASILAYERVDREAARGVLPRLSVPRRGWQRVVRDGGERLRVFSEVRAERAALVETIGEALARSGGDAAQAARIIDGLHAPTVPEDTGTPREAGR